MISLLWLTDYSYNVLFLAFFTSSMSAAALISQVVFFGHVGTMVKIPKSI
jgi:hypothetical protein